MKVCNNNWGRWNPYNNTQRFNLLIYIIQYVFISSFSFSSLTISSPPPNCSLELFCDAYIPHIFHVAIAQLIIVKYKMKMRRKDEDGEEEEVVKEREIWWWDRAVKRMTVI